MFNKIVVPLDGSELAEEAIKFASVIALANKSEILLLHVAEGLRMPLPEFSYGSSSVYVSKDITGQIVSEANLYLEEVAQRLSKQGHTISTKVVEGDVARTIVDFTRHEADLIVMTTHGYTGLTKWILGSVAEKVVGHAACPVLLVNGKRPLRKFLVPLDGSPYAEMALDPAVELAESLNGEITCLNIVEPANDVPNAVVARLALINSEWDQWLKEHSLTHAREYMESVAKSFSTRTKVPLQMVIKKNQAADGILEYAKNEQVDLIVMSTHGRSGISKWLMGSVTEKVMQQTSGHLLIIRPLL